MMKIFLVLGVLPIALMGCGSISRMSTTGNAIKLNHTTAGGHHLMVMTVADNAQVRFVSHKQTDFEGAPNIIDKTIALNVAAAFTLDTESMDVCGDHVVAGERIAGYDDVTATGHLLVVDNKISILPNSYLETSIKAAVDGKGYLFQQCLIVENGKGIYERIPKAIIDRRPHIIYRAACLMNDGSFAIVQSDELMYSEEFIDALVALGARNALYLDMGSWAWGWVRNSDGKPQQLAERFFNTRYQSNWLQIVR